MFTENNMCSDIKKASITSDIEGRFDIISKRSTIKRSADEISSTNTRNVIKLNKSSLHIIYV